MVIHASRCLGLLFYMHCDWFRKTWATDSTNQMQKQNQQRLGHTFSRAWLLLHSSRTWRRLHIFPRLTLVARVFFEFSLVQSDAYVYSDWTVLWFICLFVFYDTSLKTTVRLIRNGYDQRIIIS